MTQECHVCEATATHWERQLEERARQLEATVSVLVRAIERGAGVRALELARRQLEEDET